MPANCTPPGADCAATGAAALPGARTNGGGLGRAGGSNGPLPVDAVGPGGVTSGGAAPGMGGAGVTSFGAAPGDADATPGDAGAIPGGADATPGDTGATAGGRSTSRPGTFVDAIAGPCFA